MENYYEETINLKDLFFYIVRQWKKILIGALIGLLLGCGFSIYKMFENTPENVLKKLNALDSDKINYNNIVQYADYISLYKKELEYSKNSLLMNIDSNAVFTSNLYYSCSALEKDIESIENYYDGLLYRDDSLNKIATALGKDYENRDLKEMINLDFVVTNQNTINLNSSMFSTGSINIDVNGDSEEFVKTITDQIRTIVEQANIETISSYENVNIQLVRDSVTFGYNDVISKAQTNRINSRQGILNNLTNVKSKLSKDELLYYDYHYNYDEAFTSQKSDFAKKWPVLFAVGFGAMVAGLYFVIYLLDDHIKSFDEIKDRYHLPLLGVLNTTKKDNKNVIDKFINDLDKNEYNTLDYIKSSIKLLDEKNILLCNGYEGLDNVFNKIDSRLNLVKPLNEDNRSLEQLKKADGVILVSKLWDSKNSDIQRQIDIVNNIGKKVVGVIGLD